jgi:hypothetical protein
MAAPTLMRFNGGLHPSPHEPPTFMVMGSTETCRWRLISDPSRSSRYPDRSWGKTSLPTTSFGLVCNNYQPRPSDELCCILGCGRCPVDLVHDARYAGYHVAGGRFPVGLSSLCLLTMGFLSQAGHLGGLHRASPVPFRGSYFTPTVHPAGATPQRLIACWYRRWCFPHIPSPRFVAHTESRPP